MSGTGAGACETRIMTLILAQLVKLEREGRACHWWRQNVGAALDRNGRKITFGKPGQADIMGVVRGGYVAIETKSKDGSLSPEQREFRDKVRAAGGLYIVARCLEDALNPVLELLRDA
jgi:hypothetical protein